MRPLVDALHALLAATFPDEKAQPHEEDHGQHIRIGHKQALEIPHAVKLPTRGHWTRPAQDRKSA
jgi:hypothetical protein